MLPHGMTPPNWHDGPRWAGMKIGLLGGSFNPAHAGHFHIARIAMARFGLDAVWWLVTPQNPLKTVTGMAAYADRYASVQRIAAPHPRMVPTHLERDLGTRYSWQTVAALRSAYGGSAFVWICGMDNAAIFHKWDHWQEMARSLPVCFIARPPARSLVQPSRLRQFACVDHFFDAPAPGTASIRPGIYWLQDTELLNISSTAIRARQAG